jgi:3-hydroxyacyl-[acyl-carrier-protein] dehydratase
MQLEYFHLIDRIVDLDVDGKNIVVEAQVPKQSTIFEGHFPGYPLMPGVLLIESMAQASGWLLLGVLKFERMPILAAVKEAKVRGSVFPGDLITIEAGLIHEGSGFAVTEAKIRVGGKLRANSSLTFTLIPFPNSDMRGYMNSVADRVGFPRQVIAP